MLVSFVIALCVELAQQMLGACSLVATPRGILRCLTDDQTRPTEKVKIRGTHSSVTGQISHHTHVKSGA
jgi:hypothetical protein